MTNEMTTIFIGYIVEAIYKNGKPTMELRVRIPSVHGANRRNGVGDEKLPIAKPMIIPGMEYNADEFEDLIKSLNKVYVIFESGDLNKPVYFGIKGNSELYELPTSAVFIRLYNSVLDFPSEGSISYLYKAADTQQLYFYDINNHAYVAFMNSSLDPGDTLIGTINLFTTQGPKYGLRVIDGVETAPNDRVLILGAVGIQSGIYGVTSGDWTLISTVTEGQVVAVDSGTIYGGTLIKITDNSFMIVKKSEQVKWNKLSE